MCGARVIVPASVLTVVVLDPGIHCLSPASRRRRAGLNVVGDAAVSSIAIAVADAAAAVAIASAAVAVGGAAVVVVPAALVSTCC